MTASTNRSPSLRNDSKYMAQNMIMKFYVSKTLKAVLLLGIPDILAKAHDNRPLSAAEILEQLPTKSTPGPKSSSNLRRLFRPLVREGFFTEGYNGDKPPVYGLTEVSRWFLRDSKYSMIPIADFVLHPVSVPCWDHLHDLILDETNGCPFEKAAGVTIFESCKTNPEYGAAFLDVMTTEAHAYEWVVDNLLESGLLDGVNTIVDVGGSRGAVVADVVARNPHIQGVNFDLPHVIETAPAIIGVRHVGGSFFERVPSGDVMFLRFIVHNHGDEESIKILENCFKALPKNGKVIVGEQVLDDEDTGHVSLSNENWDLTMLALLKDARERTKEEFESLLLAAGLSKPRVIRNKGGYAFIVGYKEC